MVKATIQATTLDEDWRTPVKQYLLTQKLPPSMTEVIRLTSRALRYCLQGVELYRRSTIAPLLKCIPLEESEYVLNEIHIEARALVSRTTHERFYLNIILKDATYMVKKCDKCQKFTPVSCQPSTELKTIASSFLCSQYRMNILGPFPKTCEKRQFILVAIKYFNKWIEVEALIEITTCKVIFFLWTPNIDNQ